MKKYLLTFLSVLLTMIFTSCVSIPKTIKDGSTLVIGKIKVDASGFKSDSDYGNINGSYTGGAEVTVRDVIHGKEIVIHPDKQGFFYTTKLTAHGTYYISKVSITVNGNKGTRTMWFDFPPQTTFIPYEEAIVNIGNMNVYFNGNTNSVSWEIRDHYKVKKYFDELELETEWNDAQVYEQCYVY